MSKNFFLTLVLSIILILGLLGWNLYLINEVEGLLKTQKELELKNQMLEGDNQVLSYDLVTCRDSLRILNEREITE
ncbi:MAG: hypothetical protein COA32_08215 [Fluviicola sp.]|nr:MAG: hypothetical protein COA32_08215 [Fluviicola sp.]